MTLPSKPPSRLACYLRWILQRSSVIWSFWLMKPVAGGGAAGSEIQLAVGFPVSDEAEGEFAAFDGGKIKLLVITGVLLIAAGVDLCEQEGAGTPLFVLARTGLEHLHAPGSCLLVRAVLVVGYGGLAYDLLDVFELEGGSRMGIRGMANQRAEHDGESFHFLLIRSGFRHRALSKVILHSRKGICGEDGQAPSIARSPVL